MIMSQRCTRRLLNIDRPMFFSLQIYGCIQTQMFDENVFPYFQ